MFSLLEYAYITFRQDETLNAVNACIYLIAIKEIILTFKLTNLFRYLEKFDVDLGFRLASEEDAYTDASAEECAKLCLMSKHCTCNSFSHNPDKNRCVLGNRFASHIK